MSADARQRLETLMQMCPCLHRYKGGMCIGELYLHVECMVAAILSDEALPLLVEAIGADRLLEAMDYEPDHYVVCDEDGWFIEHSTQCRAAGALQTCEVNDLARTLDPDSDGFPGVGRWRVAFDDGVPFVVAGADE